MTSIEWLETELKKSIHYYRLIEDIESKSTIVQSNIFEQAKEMHKIELGNTWDAALDAGQSRAWNVMRAYSDFDEWYETFVSKGSGMSEKPNDHIVDTNEMVELPQQEISDNSPKEENKTSFGEISDEEIEKAVMDSMDYVYLNPNDSLIFYQGWMRAIKWYREQLKTKNFKTEPLNIDNFLKSFD
jgi:hypothetical protein